MDILDQEVLLDEKDLLTSIWTKPKLTLGYILKNCPKKYVTALLIIGGVVLVLDQNFRGLEHVYHSLIILIVVAPFVGLLSWLINYIYAILLSWTGGWINGKGKMDQFITVIAWSMVPSICSFFLLIPKFLFFGDGLFNIDMDEQSPSKFVAYICMEIIELILNIWTLVIFIKGVALIQKFNTKQAVLNAVLPVLLFLIPILMYEGIKYIIQ